MRLLTLSALLAGGCTSAPPAEDWTNFYEHLPTSILVLPVLNESSAVEAPMAFSSTITHPLSERGYYVFPVQPTLAILEENGIYEGGQLETIAPQKFRELLGADALLYVTLQPWVPDSVTAHNWSGEISMGYRMVDARTGEVIWERAARNVNDLTSRIESDPLSRVIAGLYEGVADAVSTDLWLQARHAHALALAKLPPGPLSKDHSQVREELLARPKSGPVRPRS